MVSAAWQRDITRRTALKGVGIAAAFATIAPFSRRAAAATAGAAFYVAPSGDDGNDGSVGRPFASLEAARDAVRALIAESGRPVGGVAVYLRAGRYERSSSFALTAQDSGTADSPIVYQAYGDEVAQIVGSKTVDAGAFTAVSDPAVLTRLAPAVRGNVMQVSLPEQGITNYGALQSWHFGTVLPAAPQLVFNDSLLTVARWPDAGYTAMGSIVNAGQNGQDFAFHYTDPRPSTWATIDDTWMMAYPKYNWAFQTLPISSLDAATSTITSAVQTQYGAVAGARYFYFNILEELDQPGEWYLDRSTGILYVYPPAGLGSASIRLTQCTDALVTLDGTHDVSFAGLTLGETRANAISGADVSRVAISNCAFAFIGNSAVSLTGGGGNGVADCEMHDIGTGAVTVTAGDRATLTPGDCVVEGSHFYRYSEVNPTYSPAVSCGGVGNRVAHNEIHDAPHEAIAFSGNDHVFEYNEIHHVVQDSADAGAIYGGRDWTWRGNVFRYNYLHDIENPVSGGNRVGVYLDDMLSGSYVYGNVFEHVDTAIQHSGRDNVADNNLMINCRQPVYIGNWGAGSLPTLKQRLAAVPYQQEPWASRYPELLTILDDDPGVPKYNTVIRNVFAASGAANYVADAVTYGRIMDNWPAASADLGLIDVAGGPHYLPAGSAVLKNVADFRSIPAGMVGPVSRSALLTRTQELASAFAGSGDLAASLSTQLTADLGQVQEAFGRGDDAGAQAVLARWGAKIDVGERHGSCSAPAASALATLINAMLALVSEDKFSDITLHAEKSVVAVGDTVELWLTGDMLSGQYVNVFPAYTLTSQSPRVAKLSAPDIVTALGAGVAAIQGVASHNGRTCVGRIQIPSVSSLLASISASTPTRLLDLGATTPLAVTGIDTAGHDVPLTPGDLQYSSSDPTVATVDSSGTVTGVKEGIALISVRADVNGMTADASVGLMVSPSPAILPSGWSLTNFGDTVHGGPVATQGAATYSDGAFHLMTDGANIWNESDDCTFLHTDLSGAADVTVSATVQSGTGSRAGYGVMIRDGGSASAHEVNLRQQDDGQLNLVYRSDANPNSWYSSLGPVALPIQIKLTKQGDVFTGYLMRDGAWQAVGSITVTMGAELQVGVGIYASTAVVGEAVCSDLAITQG